jgi:ribosomal protein L23
VLVRPKITEKRITIATFTEGWGSMPLNENNLTIIESKTATVRKAKMKIKDVFLVRLMSVYTRTFSFIL